MDFKELYIAEVERVCADLEDQGLTPDMAYEVASVKAYDSARERLADMGDMARLRAKDNIA